MDSLNSSETGRLALQTASTCRSSSDASGRRKVRRGVITLESIVAIPVVVIVVVATIQFSIVMLTRQAATQAAAAGARAAAKGGSFQEVVGAVNRILATHRLAARNAAGSGVRVTLEDGESSPISFGDPELTCQPPSNPAMTSDKVRVTVCLDMTAGPMINALSSFELDFTGKRLQISSLATRE